MKTVFAFGLKSLMSALAQAVLVLVNVCPGRKARELAALLRLPRRTVNQILYYGLENDVKHDESFCWYARDFQPNGQSSDIVDPNGVVNAQRMIAAREAWGQSRRTFQVILERTVRQTARVELEAPNFAEAEETALLMGDDEATSWDEVGRDAPHILHSCEWNTHT